MMRGLSTQSPASPASLIFFVNRVCVACLFGIFISTSAFARTPKFEMNIDLKGMRDEGKKFYNQEDYHSAIRIFLQLVQHNSKHAKDYLLLAWAATQANDFELSFLAYQLYFEIHKKRTGDAWKSYQELKEVVSLSQVNRDQKRGQKKVEQALKLIKDHKLSGGKGALAVIKRIHRTQVIDTRLNHLHLEFRKTLFEIESELAKVIIATTRPTQKLTSDLQRQKKLVRDWGETSWGLTEKADQSLELLTSLEEMIKKPKERVKLLKKLAQDKSVKVPQETLRQIEFTDWLKHHKSDELLMMAEGIVSGAFTEGDQLNLSQKAKLTFAYLLQVIYRTRTQDHRAVDSAMNALERSRDRARRALGIRKSRE